MLYVLTIADLEINLLTRTVRRGGVTITLQNREFRLLEFFLLNPERVVSRTTLLEKVWDMSFDPETNVVDAHVSNLRRKLDLPGRPAPIETVRGVGFRLGGPA